MIYLASPYTKLLDEDGRFPAKYLRELSETFVNMTNDGFAVYSPILHGHSVETYHPDKGPLNYEQWMQHGLCVLSNCDQMIILKQDGWLQSGGIEREYEYARERDIPVFFIKPTQSPFQANQNDAGLSP